MFEWFIAKRYIWSPRRHPFAGVISIISVIGICVGVAALIVVLAVMNGFDEELKGRIIGTRSHLIIEKDGPFGDFQGVMDSLKGMSFIKGTAPYVEGQALVQKGELATGVLVRGVDVTREKNVSKFWDYLTQGRLSNEPDRVVLGAELAKRLSVSLGSQISLLSPISKKPLVCTVEGIFSSGMYEYDANVVFLNLKEAQNLFGLGDSVSGVSVSIQNALEANRAKSIIQKKAGYPYYVRTWMEMNKTLFGALKLEKIVMFLILALIILVACLNIAGSLTILVTEKTKDIGVLKALGATPFGLVKIFALDGLLLGGAGGGAGFLIGAGISFVLEKYRLIELPKEIYYTDKLPAQMNFSDTAVVVFLAVFLSLLSSLYPAFAAAKLDPVKALRSE